MNPNLNLMKLLCCILLVCSLSMYGCAAILGGGNMTTVNCNSDPEGAKVYANGNFIGTTPAAAHVDKRRDQLFEFKLDGYETATQMVTTSAGAGWIVCDVIFGLLPVAVDAATSAWLNLDRDYVSVTLEKK